MSQSVMCFCSGVHCRRRVILLREREARWLKYAIEALHFPRYGSHVWPLSLASISMTFTIHSCADAIM
uniref:Cyclin-dependent kinases regulatory subunit n=1 Tax=Parascaris univalens TaxID=6257 RepID=A0A915A356_PARUN